MILLVDDKVENLFSLKSLLQLHKYEVDTALSGEEALKKILRVPYALVILDVQMPDMDGFEVAEAISGYSKTKSTPIIFLSAVNIDKRYISKGYASGGVDYLTKPFDPDLLLLKVQTFTRLYEQNRELKLVQDALKEEIIIRKEAEYALQQVNAQLEQKVQERTGSLLKMNNELELSNIELQQYAYVASHDLQEPLRKILTFSNMLLSIYKDQGDKSRRYVEKIIASSERMRALIIDLLTYSKLSAKDLFVQTNLNEVLSTALNDLEVSINEKQAVLHLDELPFIDAIPGQIRQVFQNLVSNSLKFSHRDKPCEIAVWADSVHEKTLDASATSNGQYLRLYVRDNGIGFDEAYANKIFTLFQRLHATHDFEGTGIGLPIVRKIVEKHHGIIGVTSKINEGTTFTLLLPIKQKPTPQPRLKD